MNKFDFNDVLIEPFPITEINSRYQEISIVDKNGTLPLFTAPMDTVVNESNFHLFSLYGINVCMPRTVKVGLHDIKHCFYSIGLNDPIPENARMILVDVANGHMKSVLKKCEEIKWKNENIKVMAGNIAHPIAYEQYASTDLVDYVRVGIGFGGGCLTTQQTGVGYPMASLIRECRNKKEENNYKLKIVADGGMKTYSDIIKALALGADYVMIGSIFNKSLESCGATTWHNIKLNQSIAKFLYDKGFTLYKEFRGMSTKEVQKLLGNEFIKTSEGVVRKWKVEYTLEGWVNNFEHYLRSAMSYTNSRDLNSFIGQVNYNLITDFSYKRFNK